MYLILGYSRTGKAVEKFLQSKGILYKIYDDKDLSIKESLKFKTEDLVSISRAITSPVFRTEYNENSIIKKIKSHNIEIISDIDLFYENLEKKRDKILIAITGTNGKSTTSALCNYVLNKLNQTSCVCGNIGFSVMDFINDKNNYKYFVIEMSSAQIEISKKVRFNYSVITNVTSDHIDYHGSLDNYINAKEKIIKMSDFCFLDKKFLNHINKENYLSKINTMAKKDIIDFSKIDFIKNRQFLPGSHNLENIYCVYKLLLKLNFNSNDIIKNICSFRGLEHRVETVIEINNVKFVNDSKATNVESLESALRSFKSKNILLIAGGVKKNKTLKDVKLFLLKKIKKTFLIGDSSDLFASELTNLNMDFEKCKDIEIATKKAFEFAKKLNRKNSIILLSPACASFDQFSNFEERGERFKSIALSLCTNKN